MNEKLIQKLGLLGIVSLLSYTVAVVLSPLAYPGYNWISAVGTAVLPHNYFGIPERFSVFAASGFTAVLGVYLYMGWKGKKVF